MEPNSILEVDLGALAQNVRTFQRLLSPGVKLCAVVKADAYGLGAVPISKRLEKVGVDWFAVYDLAQAEAILNAGISGSVLVFMPVMEGLDSGSILAALKGGRLHLTLHNDQQRQSLKSIASRLGVRIPVHVEIDTGMSRGGLLPGDAAKLINAVTLSRELTLAGVLTHLSSADTDQNVTAEQMRVFDGIVGGLPPEVIHHLANTWATLADQRYQEGMVRVGLGLWGYPSLGQWINGVRLTPIARWMSRIVHMKEVPMGTYVGYNRGFCTKRQTKIGIVPVGYADGYPLLLSNQGVIRVGAKLQPAKVIGRVNMDQLIVDLTDAADAQIGSLAELISNDPAAPNSMHQLAMQAQSHPYEMLCRISERVPRKYLG